MDGSPNANGVCFDLDFFFLYEIDVAIKHLLQK